MGLRLLGNHVGDEHRKIIVLTHRNVAAVKGGIFLQNKPI
jgi:hypothetical protein